MFVSPQKPILETCCRLISLGCLPYSQYVLKDVHQVLRIQRQDLRARQYSLRRDKIEHILILHRADVTLRLRDDKIGLQSADQIAIDLIEGVSRLEPLLYLLV